MTSNQDPVATVDLILLVLKRKWSFKTLVSTLLKLEMAQTVKPMGVQFNPIHISHCNCFACMMIYKTQGRCSKCLY